MKITDVIIEADKDWGAIDRAESALVKLLTTGDGTGRQWTSFSADEVQQAKQLVRILGRRHKIWIKNWNATAGEIVDNMLRGVQTAQAASGQMPEFNSQASTTSAMAQQIAVQTAGQYHKTRSRTWATGTGQHYRDPSDFIQYSSQDQLDDAWDWVQQQGKKVHYYDNHKTLKTAVKIGKYIIEPASVTQGVFTDRSTVSYQLSVRSSNAIKQPLRKQADITDQQAAALIDIANTRSADNMAQINAMLSVLKGRGDIQKIIAASQKLDLRDKAKLDAVIASASDYKEDL